MLIGPLVLASAVDGWSGEVGGPHPLRHGTLDELAAVLPAGTSLMAQPAAIEHFLEELDGQPPDWVTLYGHGHHNPGLDDRLFSLNRERDAKREGRPALGKPLAFVWAGLLSCYDAATGGFPVALGPRFIRTGWGMVRFKPDDAPSNLSVVTDESDRTAFERRLAQGEPVEIDVVMTGGLIPEESVVYDFSHDEEGLGLIMPFVRIEQVYFLITGRQEIRR